MLTGLSEEAFPMRVNVFLAAGLLRHILMRHAVFRSSAVLVFLERRAPNKFDKPIGLEAELGGKIDEERKTIYQSADRISAAPQDAYLAYMFCLIIVEDKSLSAADKFKALQEFQRPVRPSSQSEPVQKNAFLFT